ncbi:cytochrome b5-like [Iris pallida]|uniref:Cytochrome b5-like n=1 Tax=Iris pallida TaxID=29817 RepID=A0AAX6HK53_IRIPA|nr:cytochrome b5-like [Iris pallida]
MGSDGKVLTLEDVAKHNSKEDCWLIIGGKVYDVTKFLDDHPGGDDVLLSATGKDATDDFEDVGHSTTARAMMDEYFWGRSMPPQFLPRQNTFLRNNPTTTRTRLRISSSSFSSFWFHWSSWDWQSVLESTPSPSENCFRSYTCPNKLMKKNVWISVSLVCSSRLLRSSRVGCLKYVFFYFCMKLDLPVLHVW